VGHLCKGKSHGDDLTSVGFVHDLSKCCKSQASQHIIDDSGFSFAHGLAMLCRPKEAGP
jgi:hypothetical protein